MLFLYQINVDPFNHSFMLLHHIPTIDHIFFIIFFPCFLWRFFLYSVYISIWIYFYSGNDGGNRFGECIGWSWQKFKTTKTLQYKTTNRCQSRRKFLFLLVDDAHNVHFIQFMDAYCSTKLSRITGLYFTLSYKCIYLSVLACMPFSVRV